MNSFFQGRILISKHVSAIIKKTGSGVEQDTVSALKETLV